MNLLAILFCWYFWKSGETLLVSGTFDSGLVTDDEDRLIVDKFREYNFLIRPVKTTNSTPITVYFGLALTLLISVDEKNQIMQTNVWVTLKWFDYQMRWNPDHYSGLSSIRVPPDKVWIPDIVLFNNADGHYEPSFMSNVVVAYNGWMLWVPPAIYKSSCKIDVEYFPFDEQKCFMRFGSWTFQPDEVRLDFYNAKSFVELNDYSPSGIWDVMDVPGHLDPTGSKIDFEIKIRRKTLFYTVILIIPTVLMAFLSMMVFYLPADCSEKITLAISILLALVVFLLLVSKILPPTSDTIPLMAKYLLMTFVMNIVTILITVIIINIYFRGPTTHVMRPWIKKLFLIFLPQLLLMKRPQPLCLWNGLSAEEYDSRELLETSMVLSSMAATFAPLLKAKPNQRHHPKCHLSNSQLYDGIADDSLTLTNHQMHSVTAADHYEMTTLGGDDMHATANGDVIKKYAQDQLPPDVRTAVDAIQYITEHLRAEVEDKKIRDDWKYMAMVIDRLVLYTFFGVTVGGTFGILLSAPNVFDYVDQKEVLARLMAKAAETAETVLSSKNSTFPVN